MERIHDNLSGDLISIIVPVYKVEDKLAACVESLLAQTYQNLEIILVDDGSPDNCPAMCDAYASRDSRIRVVHKVNGGLSDARNVGLDQASGDWIGFVDSDDWVDTRMFGRLLDLAANTHADIAVCNYLTVEEGVSKEAALRERAHNPEVTVNCTGVPALNGRFVEVEGVQDPCFMFGVESDRTLDRNAAMELLLEDKALQNYVWNKLYRRELWQTVRFPVGQYFEDINTTWKVFDQAKRVALAAWPGYYYRQRPGSIVHSGNFRMELDCVLAGIERYEALKDDFPNSSDAMVDNILQTFIKVWGLAWENRKISCGEKASKMAELAAFARDHRERVAFAARDLGITGKCTLWLLNYDSALAYAFANVLHRAYLAIHG